MSTPGPVVIDVGDADFEREVIARSRTTPVVVDFWAEWCGPCRILGPVLERLVSEFGGRIVLAKVDVDRAPETALRFGVQSIPYVVAFRDGEPAGEFLGVIEEDRIREFLSRLVPSAGEDLCAEAEALEESDPGRAEALYREAAEREPDNERPLLGLARLALKRGDVEAAEALLDRVPEGGEFAEEAARLRSLISLGRRAAQLGDVETARARVEAEPESAERRYELGCALAGAGRYEEALQELLRAAELDRELGRGKVREAMVEIFYVVGARSALADEYRTRLSRTLY